MSTHETSVVSAETVRALLEYRCESNALEFKRQLDTRQSDEFLAVLKDFGAFADTDGGHILIGVVCKDDIFDVVGNTGSTFLEDPTVLGQRAATYCSQPLSFTIRKATLNWKGAERDIWVIHIERSPMPVMFTKNGDTEGASPRRLFGKNDIYIRQNAASTPAAPYQVEALLRARGFHKLDELRELLEKLLGYNVPHLPARKASAPSKGLHNLPPGTYSTFVGREDEISSLLDFLNNPNRRLVTIDGIGGVGKTALVREFAARLAQGSLSPNQSPELILWLSAKTRELTPIGPREIAPDPISDVYQQICRIVVPKEINQIDDPKREALSLLSDTPALVVLDNLEDLAAGTIETLTNIVINEFPPYTVKVIFTTRHVAIREGGSLRIPALSVRDASALVDNELRLRGLSLSEEEKGRLILRTGRIPLAIKYLVGRFQYASDIPGLIQNIERDEALLEFIFRETFGILSQTERLTLFAACLEDSAGMKSLQAATGRAVNELEAAIQKLRSVSFLDYDPRGPAYTMSPLTRAFAEQELSKDLDLNLELQRRLKRHKDIVRLTEASEALATDMQDALLLCRHATTLMAKGELSEADEEFDRAEREFSEARKYILMARGDICFDLRRYREALNAYLRADTGGVEGQPRLHYRLAWLLINVDRPDVQRAFAYAKRAVGLEPENPVYLKLLGEIASALEDDAAESWLQKALYNEPRGLFQKNHSADIYTRLAEIALYDGRDRDAEERLAAADYLDPRNPKIAELRRKMHDPEVMRAIAADRKRRGKRKR